jgi:hypothetical protein
LLAGGRGSEQSAESLELSDGGWGKRRDVGQDKADISSSQISGYVFVCTSFFRETVCLPPGAAERLSVLSRAANGRLLTFVGETL